MSFPYIVATLYSGSTGNATYICAGGAKILIDAGKCTRTLCASLSRLGVSIDEIDAIFLTHEHRDHTGSLEVLTKKHSIPVHVTKKSALRLTAKPDSALAGCIVTHPPIFHEFVKDLRVTSFPTPHDSRESVGYHIEFEDDEGNTRRIGYATDIGHVPHYVHDGLIGCESVVLESNHDPEMLWGGPYPYDLKERIASRWGHLSNPDCAEFAAELTANGTKNILLAHLSQENNDPQIAYNEVMMAIADPSVNLRAAAPDEIVVLIDGLTHKEEVTEC
jgi:phosphoribosyl 1,2-cyclic phosphodiesterase